VNEDKAVRYHRLKRRADVLSLVWSASLLIAVLLSGWHLLLRDAAEALLPRAPVVAFVILLSLLNELGSLPIAFYSGFLIERRYGLSSERLGTWLADQAKSFAIGVLLGAPAAALVYGTIRAVPALWWLPAGLLFALIIVVMTNLAPVLLLPVFYTVKPLAQERLRTRLLTLAERAGARVLGAYEWGLGEKTRKANAALTGLGSTRRILVSDTMLAAYSEEEIEVVLAHELAHHVHGDIWKGIGFESALVLGGFYAASVVLERFAPAIGLRSVADIAGLPLLLIAVGALSVLMVPLALALSRRFERSADRFALHLTQNPGAFVSAMRRLAAQNLAEDNPSRIVQWLFYSHPPIRERIAAAQTPRRA
jgi:STE24 endopeptidase